MELRTGRRPAGRGLDGSDYVVSVVRSDSPIDSYVNEDGMVCLVLPGKPCGVLLGLAGDGAKTFLAHLIARLQEAETHERR